MLVLGRRPGEYIKIGDDITVKVVKSEDGHLRLAIDAPKHVKITRGELLDNQQNKQKTICSRTSGTDTRCMEASQIRPLVFFNPGIIGDHPSQATGGIH